MPRKARSARPKGRKSKQTNRKDSFGTVIRQTASVEKHTAYPLMSPFSRVLGGFPSRMRTRNKYVSNVVLNPVAGTAGFTFALNAMYDPDITGSGHQPSNFDILTQIYYNHTVIEAAFLMQWVPQDSTSQDQAYYGFLINTNGSYISGSTATNNLMEQPYSMYAPYGAGVPEGKDPGTLTARTPIGEWFGIRRNDVDALIAKTDCSGTPSANPASLVYAEIWASPVNANTPGGTSNFRIEILQDVIWSNPLLTKYS